MNFHNSSTILHLFWLVPSMLILTYLGHRKRQRRIATFICNSQLAQALTTNVSMLKRRFRDMLFIGGICFLCMALAGPHWGTKLVKRPSHSRDLLIVLDCSRSMLATDISPSRMKHAKWFIRTLIDQTPGDRYGLIAFSGTAFLECPLTQDRNGILLFLDDIDTDTIPVGGTNIQEALQTALEAFKAAEGSHRAIILITDGDELQGNSKAILDDLKERNIPIFAVGIGDPNLGSFIQIEGNKFITDADGNRVNTKLNEASLRRIAESVGGTYVHSTSVHDGIDHIAGKVRALIPEQQENNTVSRPIERYQMPLLIGFICLLIRLLLGERKTIKKGELATMKTGLASLAIITVNLFFIHLCLQASTLSLFAQDDEPPAEADGAGKDVSKSSNPLIIDPQLPLPPPGTSPNNNLATGVPQSPMRLPGIEEEKAALIRKSIKSLNEKIEKSTDPMELGYLHYNLGVNYQLLGNKDQAEQEYNKALDARSESKELAAVAYQNLGVLKHSDARENLGVNPDQALENLNDAQDFYREAMRNNPKLNSIAKNQELVLRERKLIQELKKIQEELSDLQNAAEEKTKEAHDAQQQANQEQDLTSKEQKQEEALNKTQEAQEATNQLEKAAKELGQEQAEEWYKQAANTLKEATKEQEKALNSSANNDNGEKDPGENAEELISQALHQLGSEAEKEEGEEDQMQLAESDEAKKKEESENSDLGDEDKQSQHQLSMSDNHSETDSEKKSGQSEKLQNFDKLQALRILDDLEQHEKDLKQEMKEIQKQNRRIKETEKNW